MRLSIPSAARNHKETFFYDFFIFFYDTPHVLKLSTSFVVPHIDTFTKIIDIFLGFSKVQGTAKTTTFLQQCTDELLAV
jgi:hypothetical protein